MNRSATLTRLALTSTLFTLVACTGMSSRKFEPLPVDEHTFSQHVNAEPIHRAEANQLVALAECAETGRIELASESPVSSAEALDNLLRQFRIALARSGSNTYVLENVEWVPATETADGARVELQVRGLICGA